MAIPKIIHYCWFGGEELPDTTKTYMESWKKYCPDYQIKEWNESNFDINSCRFVKEAYEKKKWAFVSDYVRFYAMYTEGGVYVETDAEILRPIDELLGHGAFFGLAGDDTTLSLCGTEKGHPVAKDIIDLYKEKHFVKDDGSLNTVIINKELFDLLVRKFGLPVDKKDYQVLKYNTSVYPEEFFFSYDYVTGLTNLNDKLFVRHYGNGSWLDEKDRKKLDYQHKYVQRYGRKIGLIVGKTKYYVDKEGIVSALKHAIQFLETRLHLSDKNRKGKK